MELQPSGIEIPKWYSPINDGWRHEILLLFPYIIGHRRRDKVIAVSARATTQICRSGCRLDAQILPRRRRPKMDDCRSPVWRRLGAPNFFALFFLAKCAPRLQRRSVSTSIYLTLRLLVYLSIHLYALRVIDTNFTEAHDRLEVWERKKDKDSCALFLLWCSIEYDSIFSAADMYFTLPSTQKARSRYEIFLSTSQDTIELHHERYTYVWVFYNTEWVRNLIYSRFLTWLLLYSTDELKQEDTLLTLTTCTVSWSG